MTTPEQKIARAIQLIKENPAGERHFFSRVSEQANPVVWLEPLRNEGYFDPEHNPDPVEDPNNPGYYSVRNWQALEFLKVVAKFNKSLDAPDITSTLVEIIDRICDYRLSHKRENENWASACSMVELIAELPAESISVAHIEYVEKLIRSRIGRQMLLSDATSTLFARLLSEKSVEKSIRLLESILNFTRQDDNTWSSYTSAFGNYELQRFLETQTKDIAKLCAEKAAEIGIAKMTQIAAESDNSFSFYRVRTIEPHEQSEHGHDYEHELVRFVRDMLEAANIEFLSELLPRLMAQENRIFLRLSLHIISLRWEELSELFWRIKYNPIDVVDISHELYSLMEKNSSRFDADQIDIVLNWIEKRSYFETLKVREVDERERIEAYRKKEWLLSLRDTKNSIVQERFETYDSISPETVDHAGFNFWVSSARWVKDERSSYDFSEKTIDQIVKDMQARRPESHFDQDDRILKPGEFADQLRTNGSFYVGQLSKFVDVQMEFQHCIFEGLTKQWEEKQEIDVVEVLSFADSVLSPNKFWEEDFGDHYNYRNMTVRAIACFIQEGTKTNKRAFDDSTFGSIESILVLLAEKVEPAEIDTEPGWPQAGSVLNSALGDVYRAMLNFSLHYARLRGTRKKGRWIPSIRSKFIELISERNRRSTEVSVILGEYLPQIRYLDPDWFAKNLDLILPENDKIWWETMAAYLAFPGPVHMGILRQLRDHGDYQRAIKKKISDEQTLRSLVHHICLSFIHKDEELNDSRSLISLLLKECSWEYHQEVAQFIPSAISREKDVEFDNRIEELWDVLLETAETLEPQEKREGTISELGSWISIIDDLNAANFERLRKSAPYTKRFHDDHDFIKGLEKHSGSEPLRAGLLFFEMLSSIGLPDYDKEEIRSIVTALLKDGQQELEDLGMKICNRYLEAGSSLLRSVCDKYGPTQEG